MTNHSIKLVLFLVFNLVVCIQVSAQLTFTGQLRTRTELRDGFGNLPTKGAKAGFFTSQRARLNVGYNLDKLKFFSAVQDVRVWGQDASTISAADGNKLMLHEMWSEITLAAANDSNARLKIDYLGLKIGRQEISYDDQRLLGNLDWLQQGRRHDAAILKLIHKGYQVDLGAAYNQNAETKEGKIYVPGNVSAGLPAANIPATGTLNPAGTNGIGMMYKSMQYLYVARKFKNTRLSGLIFKDDFQKSLATVLPATGRVFVKGVNSRITSGLNVNTVLNNASGLGALSINASGYYQGQNDPLGNVMDAYFASVYTGYQVGDFSIGPGYDYYSGNNGNSSSPVNHRFDPLYGTPHKFAGLMDYFYAGDGFGPAGLKDLYVKTRYTRQNLTLTLDAHRFTSGNEIRNTGNPDNTQYKNSRNLGTEIDFTANYAPGKIVSFELGYARMFGTKALNQVKTTGYPALNSPVVAKELNGNWAYLMINIRPDFLMSKTQVTPNKI